MASASLCSLNTVLSSPGSTALSDYTSKDGGVPNKALTFRRPDYITSFGFFASYFHVSLMPIYFRGEGDSPPQRRLIAFKARGGNRRAFELVKILSKHTHVSISSPYRQLEKLLLLSAKDLIKKGTSSPILWSCLLPTV